MRRMFVFLLVILLSGCGTVYAAAPVDLSKIIIRAQKTANETQLARASALIVYGTFGNAVQEVDTKQKVGAFKLINTVQPFKVIKVLKGNAPGTVQVLATGTDPLPDIKDPIGNEFPGELVSGTYVCFLQKVPGESNMYHLLSGFQSLYPVTDGKLISLKEQGFPQYNGLTVEQLRERLQAITR